MPSFRHLAAKMLIAVTLAAPATAQMPSIPEGPYNNPITVFQRDVQVLNAEQALLKSQMRENAPPPATSAAEVAQVNELKRQFWQYAVGVTAQTGGTQNTVAKYAANHYALMTGRITPVEYQQQRAALLSTAATPQGQHDIQKALADAQKALDPAAQQRLAQLSFTDPSALDKWTQFEPAAWKMLVQMERDVDVAKATLAKDKRKADTVFDDSIVWRTRLQDTVTSPYQALVQTTGYRNMSIETAIQDLNSGLNALQAAARAARK